MGGRHANTSGRVDRNRYTGLWGWEQKKRVAKKGEIPTFLASKDTKNH